MRTGLTLLLIIEVAASAQNFAKEQSTDAIIERLKKNPADSLWVGELAQRSDPQVIPALRELFTQAKLSGAIGFDGRPTSQVVAANLMHLGVKDDVYFNELAGYVRDDISADPPEPYLSDSEGREDTTKRNPVFEQWCAIRNLEFMTCTRMSASFVVDFGLLAMASDNRAIPLLRQGLSASNGGIVLMSAASLARLNDTLSIPLIAKACARLPAQMAEIIAIKTAEFNDPGVLGLVDRFVRDPETREKVKKEWQDRQTKTPSVSDRKE